MDLFSSRKRQSQPAFAPVREAAPAPLPLPAEPAPLPSEPLGSGLRVVTPSAVSPVALTALPPAEQQDARADDLHGLPLGTILFRMGLVEQSELEEALVDGMQSGERLGEVLLRRALVSEEDIGRGLAAQQGLVFLHDEDLRIDSEVAALLPPAEANSLGAVAVRIEDGAVLVVTAEPSARQRGRLEALLGRSVTEAVVSRAVFHSLVERIAAPGGLLADNAPVFELVAETVESTDLAEVAEAEPFALAEVEPMSESQTEQPVDEAPALLRHELEEEQMDQVWTAPEAGENGESVLEEQPEPTTPEEIWGEAAPETEDSSSEWNDDERLEAVEASIEPEPSWTPEAEASWDMEPASDVSHGEVSEASGLEELGAQHDASVGRIDELLTRIHEGASTYVDLRAQLGGLTENLKTTEEALADRERRLGELTEAHESDQRRIDELVGQVHDREQALSGLGERVEDLSGRLVSAEERLDEREQRLAELDASLAERVRYVEGLSAQVERRDRALSTFEERLAAIATQIVADDAA